MTLDILLIIIGSLMILVGLAGCLLPILPRPPLSWLGLVVLKLSSSFTEELSWKEVLLWGILVVTVTLIDTVLPVLGSKKTGGGKVVVWGATFGLTIGLFIGPLGIITGPFIGAFIGAILDGNKISVSLRQSSGTFIGLFTGIILKLICSGLITYAFLDTIF